MDNRLRFLEFNLGILFISSSAVLGRYITSSSSLATLWRCLIAAMCLCLMSLIFKRSLRFDWKRHGVVLVLTSAMMAVHWTSYFYSLDYSNVSVALMTLYTFPAITAILEPVWRREKIPQKDIALALTALLAVYIIAPPFDVGSEMSWAIGLGLFSAFTYSIRNIWVTSISTFYSGTTLMTYQLSLMSLFLMPVLIWTPVDIEGTQWAAILILGVVTTAMGHTLFMRGLTFYKATTASIIACIVPVYAITLGYLILDEVPTLRTLAGGVLIIGIVIVKATEKKSYTK